MMLRAGFVLTGGASRRMGRDKALLGWRGTTLLEHVAARVREAAGSVTLVGAPERYHWLAIPAIPDRYPGQGPLGGIATALAASEAEWNVVVACDMPLVDAALLRALLARAAVSAADCVVPQAGGFLEPLCAVYHRRCLEPFMLLLERGVRRMTEALAGVEMEAYPVKAGDRRFANLNRPEDHARHLSSLHRVPPRL